MNRWIATVCTSTVAVGVAVVACTGDAGPKGDKGDPGPAGGSGATGATGAAGAPGPGGGSGDGGGGGGGLQLSARAKHGLDISPVAIATAGLTSAQAEQVGQGSYLVNAIGACNDCHTPGGPPPVKFLAGGTAFAIDGTNVVYARNLTPDATTGMRLTEAEFVTAMRTGKDFGSGGQSLLVMPWPQMRWLTTTDLTAMYAYLKVIPPVANAVTADVKATSILNGPPAAAPAKYDEGDVVRLLPPEKDATGGAVVDANAVQRGLAIRPLAAPADLDTRSPDAQALIGRGAYVANAAQCNDCHTNPARQSLPAQPGYLKVNTAAYLAGGGVFAVPPPLQPVLLQARSMSADLTGATNGFLNEPEDSFGRFLAVITSGTHADESTDGEPARALGWPMPWAIYKNMELGDLEALYAYLKTLPPRNGASDKATQDYAPYCSATVACPPGQTCNTATSECIGAGCTPASAAEDCAACQVCTASKCAAPAAGSTCVSGGI